jgi:hypothetical protein
MIFHLMLIIKIILLLFYIKISNTIIILKTKTFNMVIIAIILIKIIFLYIIFSKSLI